MTAPPGAVHVLKAHTFEPEQRLLGSLLIDGSAIERVSRAGVRPQHLEDPRHKRIFQAMLDCLEVGDSVDVLTVSERDAGDLGYIATLAAETPTARNVDRFAEIVLDRAAATEFSGILDELRERARIPGADIPALKIEAAALLAPADAPSHGWPDSLDLVALADREPRAPQSIMEGVPCDYATGDFGHGGAGKSQIELTRAVCIAAGVPFCGLEVQRRKVLFVSCEDRADILHWRMTRICTHLGIDLKRLHGWLQILDLVGRDSILFAPDPRTGQVLTAAYRILADRMREYGSEVLFLDGITDTFGGNENARGEVKRYVNSLIALIPPGGALILIGHVNKTTARGDQNGEGYSGSTSWHNSCRARWFLSAETLPGEDGGTLQRTGKLILELQKSNHGEIGAQIEFEWDPDAHLFVGRGKGITTEFDRNHLERTEQAGILRALKGCVDAGIIVHAAMQGPYSAFLTLSLRPEFPASLRGGNAGSRRRWKRHIENLRQIRAIEESEYRRSHRKTGAQFALTAEGLRQCAEY